MSPPQTLFRPEAIAFRLQRNRAAQTQSVPTGHRTQLLLGGLLVLLIVLGAATFLRPVDRYAHGVAIVVQGDTAPSIALLLDSSAVAHIHPGQVVTLDSPDGGSPQESTIAAVEPAPITSSTFASLGIDPLVAQSLPPIVTLAWLTLDDHVAPTSHGLLNAETAIGSTRAGTVLPFVGTWFGA